MSVGRICRREVHVARAGESALAAARRMAAENVGTLVVVDEEGRPAGIVTDRDLVLRVMAQGRDPSRTPVMYAMTVAPRHAEEDTSIEDALARMREGPFRRLIVVGSDGRLVGVVTLDDVLELLGEELRAIGDLVAAEEPNR